MNLLTKQEIETWVSAKETIMLSGNQIDLALRTALDALARLEDAEAAQALVVERAAEAVIAGDTVGTLQRKIRALASPSGVAALAALRAERDKWQKLAERGVNVAEAAEAQALDLRTRLATAEGRVAALTEAGRDRLEARVEAVIRRNFTAPEDTAVEALCLRFGYGAVMDAASRLWARSDMLGAFYIGGCIGFRTEEEARAALATVTPPAGSGKPGK